MLMTLPPQERYMCDSARVENWGPSVWGFSVSMFSFLLCLSLAAASCWERKKLTHADNSALLVQDDALALHMRRALLDDLRKPLIKRIREANVAHDAALEKGERAHALGTVNDLVRDDKVHGLDLLAQGADGREGDDAADADGAQGGDVGAGGHLVGRELVVQAVAGEEGNGDAVVLEDADRGGGLAPGGRGRQLGDGRVAFELSEAGAADDGDVDGACLGGQNVSRVRRYCAFCL